MLNISRKSAQKLAYIQIRLKYVSAECQQLKIKKMPNISRKSAQKLASLLIGGELIILFHEFALSSGLNRDPIEDFITHAE